MNKKQIYKTVTEDTNRIEALRELYVKSYNRPKNESLFADFAKWGVKFDLPSEHDEANKNFDNDLHRLQNRFDDYYLEGVESDDDAITLRYATATIKMHFDDYSYCDSLTLEYDGHTYINRMAPYEEGENPSRWYEGDVAVDAKTYQELERMTYDFQVCKYDAFAKYINGTYTTRQNWIANMLEVR